MRPTSPTRRAIVLDGQQPGRPRHSAFRIRDALLSAQEPVNAYVAERAYSAAALISLSANRIVMAPGASIGAAEPVEAGGTVPRATRWSRRCAASSSRPRSATTTTRNLAGAMVDKNVICRATNAPA